MDRPHPRPRHAPGTRTLPWEALAMVLVAFALRALCAWFARGLHPAPGADEIAADAIAWNLARGLGFALGDGATLHSTAAQPPLAPFLASLAYRWRGHDLFAALLLQCAAASLVPVVLAGFARATWGSGVARIAGWLAAFHPLMAFACVTLHPETLFSLALLVALAASAEWVKTPRPARALGTGMLWGAAALTRPDALALPLVVAAWSWFPLGLTLASRDRLRQASMLLLGVVVVAGPWTLRNARELGAFVPVATALSAAAPAVPALARFDPLLLGWTVLTLPLAIFGASTLLASPKRIFLVLPLVSIAVFSALAAAYPATPSSRVPIEPLVVWHAAVGADALWKRRPWRRHRLELVPPLR